MKSRRSVTFIIAQIMRWSARALSVAFIVISAFFVWDTIRKAPGSFGPLALLELVLFAALSLSLIFAWFREGVGGSVCLAILAGFYVVEWILFGEQPPALQFVLMAIPALQFLAYDLLVELDGHAKRKRWFAK